MEINKLELAWAAGFFDGEGNVNLAKDKEARRLRLRAFQTDREPLERLQKAVLGLGKIYGPYEQGLGSFGIKKIYHWDVSNFKDVQMVSCLLLPFLCSIKASQILVGLKIQTKKIIPPTNICKYGHTHKTGIRCPTCIEAYYQLRKGNRAAARNLIPIRTHCKHGHPFTEDNIYRDPRNRDLRMECRACRKIAMERFKAKTGAGNG
jgi:hypothetical protein